MLAAFRHTISYRFWCSPLLKRPCTNLSRLVPQIAPSVRADLRAGRITTWPGRDAQPRILAHSEMLQGRPAGPLYRSGFRNR